jgi:hypothetical protein
MIYFLQCHRNSRLGITPPTIYDSIPPEARDIIPAV